jgi:hypothetical protein
LVRFAPPGGGDVPFDIGITGDHRGRFLAVQAHAVDERNQPQRSSEMSEGVLVP